MMLNTSQYNTEALYREHLGGPRHEVSRLRFFGAFDRSRVPVSPICNVGEGARRMKVGDPCCTGTSAKSERNVKARNPCSLHTALCNTFTHVLQKMIIGAVYLEGPCTKLFST